LPAAAAGVTVLADSSGGGAIYSTVVVGTDGSATAELALARAIELARLAGATLHVVTVSGREPTPASPGEPRSAPSTRVDFQADVTLQRALERQRGGDLQVEQHVRTGDPATEIVAISRQLGADVVVLGSRGMRGAGRLLGSIPNKVSHRAPCDVLIVLTT
jgi:nucleotide-binding universal stress UspA family protein